ncbi:hypothetical protein GWK47_034735 [Chionoecetes opilio]|uniref:Uncharacterized protein n=1 Tax=Chionoecetes opilio TaxID=41210 RepID=A0A8J4YG70_CHIOP|nr:hypothetical protein GWK47_034735 [Chionoecetes opilio]
MRVFLPVPSPPTECLAVTHAEVTWAWSPQVVAILAWADPSTPDAPILQITLPDPSRPHLIALHADRIKEEVGEEVREAWLDGGWLGPGWAKLRLDLTDNVTLSVAGQDGRHLVSRPLPRHLHNLHLAGSNLTADCHSGQVVWRVGGIEWVGVPLAGEREGEGNTHPFLLYSHQAILVSLEIPGAKETLTLAWDPQRTRLHVSATPYITRREGATSRATSTTLAPAAASLQPLPPFTAYLLRLVCGDVGGGAGQGVRCELREEEEEEDKEGRLLKALYVPSAPWMLRLRGEGQELFFLRQDTTKSLPPTPYQHPKPPTAPLPTPTIPSPLPPHSFASTRSIAASDGLPPPTATQPPATTNIPTGDKGGGHRGGAAVGWSGWWVILTVLLSILLVFVVVMCVVSHYHRPKLEKYLGGLHLIPEEDLLDPLERPPCPERRPLMLRSVSIINTDDLNAAAPLRLWNAVASGDAVEVEQVMATLSPDPNSRLGGQDTTPYQEAHHRGHTPVLRVLEAAMDKRPDVPHNDMVLSVMQVMWVFGEGREGKGRVKCWCCGKETGAMLVVL